MFITIIKKYFFINSLHHRISAMVGCHHGARFNVTISFTAGVRTSQRPAPGRQTFKCKCRSTWDQTSNLPLCVRGGACSRAGGAPPASSIHQWKRFVTKMSPILDVKNRFESVFDESSDLGTTSVV